MIWRHQNQADYVHTVVCVQFMCSAITVPRKVSSSIYGYYKAETSSFGNPHELQLKVCFRNKW